MRKIRTLRAAAAAFFALMLTVILCVPAFGAYEDKMGIVVALDQNEELVARQPGICLMDGDGVTVISDMSVLSEDAYAYFVVIGDEAYPLETPKSNENFYISVFQITDLRPPSDYLMGISGAFPDVEYTTLYLDGNANLISGKVVFDGVETVYDNGLTELHGILLDADPSNIAYFPAVCVDENGNMAAILTRTGNCVSFATDPAAFGGGSGGGNEPTQDRRDTGGGTSNKRNYLLYGGIGIGAILLIAIVYALSSKSKKTPPPAPRNDYPKPAPPPGNDYPQPKNDYPKPAPAPIPPTEPFRQPAPAPRQISYSVMAVSGSMQGRVYPIDKQGLVFGRDASCNVSFSADTKGISRKHCRLFYDAQGHLMLMDYGSTYGTYLKGTGKLQPQTPVPVKRGSLFCLASEKIMFQVQ